MAKKHLSYRQFKNIFGDLGVTAWTKYNWLFNGMPDGEYNGIIKKTYDHVDGVAANGLGFINLTVAGGNANFWNFGWSNYETLSIQVAMVKGKTGIAPRGSVVVIYIKGIEETLESYNNYLRKHPFIIFYADPAKGASVWAVSNSYDSSDFYRSEGISGFDQNIVRMVDLSGEYEWINRFNYVDIESHRKAKSFSVFNQANFIAYLDRSQPLPTVPRYFIAFK